MALNQPGTFLGMRRPPPGSLRISSGLSKLIVGCLRSTKKVAGKDLDLPSRSLENIKHIPQKVPFRKAQGLKNHPKFAKPGRFKILLSVFSLKGSQSLEDVFPFEDFFGGPEKQNLTHKQINS